MDEFNDVLGLTPTGLGRPPKEFDLESAIDMLDQGYRPCDVAKYHDISVPTLRKRIADLQAKQGILLNYRAVQSLQLTELQARILEAITPEKIEDATLKDLVMCYKILKEKELVIEGKPSDIKGLLAHLVYLEKQEKGLIPQDDEEYRTDAVDIPIDIVGNEGELTTLSDLDQEDF